MPEDTGHEPIGLMEAARRLKLGPSSVLHRIYTGRIAATRSPDDRRWEIDPRSVEDYLSCEATIAAIKVRFRQPVGS